MIPRPVRNHSPARAAKQAQRATAPRLSPENPLPFRPLFINQCLLSLLQQSFSCGIPLGDRRRIGDVHVQPRLRREVVLAAEVATVSLCGSQTRNIAHDARKAFSVESIEMKLRVPHTSEPGPLSARQTPGGIGTGIRYLRFHQAGQQRESRSVLRPKRWRDCSRCSPASTAIPMAVATICARKLSEKYAHPV